VKIVEICKIELTLETEVDVNVIFLLYSYLMVLEINRDYLVIERDEGVIINQTNIIGHQHHILILFFE
jgi:hypothetical protein